MRIASLPWYDLPSTHRAVDAFWSILRDALHAEAVDRLPARLNRRTSMEAQWCHEDLLISQCCGLDLFTPAASAVSPIGRPVFNSMSCEPGNYFSHIVAAPGAELPSSRIVINAPSSHSGCTALLSWMQDRAWTPGEVLISGSHQESVAWIRHGLADVAAIDAHTWRLIDRDGVEIVGRSDEAPAPPFIRRTRGDIPGDVLLRALQNAVSRGGSAIGVGRIIPSDFDVYRPMANEAALLVARPLTYSDSEYSA